MDDLWAEWSKFLFEHSPKLLRQLDGIIDDEIKRPGIAYGNFYTRQQREPTFIDRRMHRNVFGIISEEPVERYYNNDNMIEITVLTNLQQEYNFRVNCWEFLEPTRMEEHTNELQSLYYSYSYMPVNYELAQKVRNVVWNWLQDCIYMKMAQDRMKVLKKDIIASVWHPERVSKWIEAGVALENL